MLDYHSSSLLAPRTFRFTDVDQFRSSVRNLDVEFTPLTRRIAAEQIILSLGGCDVNFTSSFARITEARVAPNCTAVGFSMDDGVPIRFNGLEEDQSVIAIGSDGASYTAVERADRQYASIIFTSDVQDRGWTHSGASWQVFDIDTPAHHWLRVLVRHILALAPTFKAPEAIVAAASMKESLLAGIDAALANAQRDQRVDLVSRLKTFNTIKAVLASNLGVPLYSEELARKVGVSVRALQNAVQQYLGMSLHQYLRLRRLWLARQRLLKGGESVKACALALGFWHLSDFARTYRAQFGELPSDTLTRSGARPLDVMSCLGLAEDDNRVGSTEMHHARPAL